MKGDVIYITSYESKNEHCTFKIKHFTRAQHGNKCKCKHIQKLDCVNLYSGSIVDCYIDGEWDVLNENFDTLA